MGTIKQLHVLQNETLLTIGKLEIIHNDQVTKDTCDLETLDHFHNFGTPILQCYKDIHNIMVTNTQVHNTINIHNSYAGLMQSCQKLWLELQTLKEAFKSLNVSS
jgi:hypothetical protein